MKLDWDDFTIDISNYHNLNLYIKALNKVRELIADDYDFLQVIDGRIKTGVGKSTIAIFSAKYVDENFNVEKIAFADIRQILRLVKKASTGDAIVIDEGGVILFSRQWRSKEALLFNKVLMIARAKRLFLQVVLPSVFFLDKYVRLSLHALVSARKRGLADYYFGKDIIKAWAGHIITMNPRHQLNARTPEVGFTFEFPSLKGWKLFEEYYQRKLEFIDKQLDEWLIEIEEGEENGHANESVVPQGYMTYVDIIKRLKAHGIEISYDSLRRTIAKLGLETRKHGRRTLVKETDFPYILEAVMKKGI
ncbi:hypothetical protein [Pyrococcus kukulkanii]|uniref:hypothetical protein n=1 Tax=Pyrococcus kukulkanii TaxID=1609559 RepID=UPI003565B18A